MTEGDIMKAKNKIQIMIHLAVLITLEIVLSRFLSISTPVVKISFAFLPVAIGAMLYGPMAGGIIGGLSDLVGAILFPIGMYFPGFTLSAFLIGVIYGVLLSKNNTWMNLILAVLISRFCISLLLSTYWLVILTNMPFAILFSTRLIPNLIIIPIEIFVIRLFQAKIHLLQPCLASSK